MGEVPEKGIPGEAPSLGGASGPVRPAEHAPPQASGGAEPQLYFRQLLSGRDFGLGDDAVAGQMRNFVYLVGDQATGEAMVVDPAYDPPALVEVAEEDGMRIVGVLVTHHHPDHVGGDLFGYCIRGVAELLEIVSVPVHCQITEADFVRHVAGVGKSDLITHSGSGEVAVGAFSIEMIHTPGHTPGSQCFLVQNRLLAGDTLFLEGCGRTDFPGGDAGEMYLSLTQRLAKVPDSADLFPGHDYSNRPSASLGETRRLNYVFSPRTAMEWMSLFGR